MKDFQLTHDNFNQFVKALQEELAEHNHLSVNAQAANTGKWGMAKLWRVWMKSTGEWMAGRGATMPLMVMPDGSHYGERPFDHNDAHELFTYKWLGADSDGNRLSWAKQGHDGMRPANKGERFLALMHHEEWALNKGIILMKPRDSEYAKLEREQNQ